MMNMARPIGVIAWVGATIVSVGVSTAAVDAVRAQVTQRPSVVSVATLRSATSTTTIVSLVSEVQAADPTTPPPSSGSTAIDTTTTTRAWVEATPATIVEPAPLPATSPDPTPPSDDEAADTETRRFRGGTVTLSFDGDTIELIEAVPEEGYEVSIESQRSDRLVVRFVDEGRSSALVAQVVDDRLHIRIFD
jgi:hypothetical protein